MSLKTVFYLGSIMVIAQVMLIHAQKDEVEKPKQGGCKGCGHHHAPKTEPQNAPEIEVEKLEITPVESDEVPQSIDTPKITARRNSKSPTSRSRSPSTRSKSPGEVEKPKQEVQKSKGSCKGCGGHHHHGQTAEKQNGAVNRSKSPTTRPKSRSPSPKPEGRSNSRGSSPRSGSRSGSPIRGPEPVIVADTRRSRSPIRAQ